MFLARLLDRAAGTAPTLQNVGSLAKEFDEPAWGPVADEGADAPEPETPVETRPMAQVHRAAPKIAGPEARPVPPTPPAPQKADATPRTAKAGRVTGPAPSGQADAPLPPTQPSAPSRQRAETETRVVGTVERQTVDRVTRVTVAAHTLRTRPARSNAEPDAPPAEAARETARSEAQESRIELHLDIGRIDLVRQHPEGPARPDMPSRARPGPGLSLADYLSARRGSRS